MALPGTQRGTSGHALRCDFEASKCARRWKESATSSAVSSRRWMNSSPSSRGSKWRWALQNVSGRPQQTHAVNSVYTHSDMSLGWLQLLRINSCVPKHSMQDFRQKRRCWAARPTVSNLRKRSDNLSQHGSLTPTTLMSP